MTAIYDHRCKDCGPIIVETETISEYLAFKEEYGVAKGGNIQVPCPSCGEMAPRDYQAGTAPFKVKGGTLYKSDGYANEVKKNWYQEEVNNTKEVLKFNKGKNPYSCMSLDDPSTVGAGRIDDTASRNKADNAKKVLGNTKAAVDANIARSKI